MRFRTFPVLVATLLGLGAGSPTAHAGPRDFLICIPGSPGSAAGAKAYMSPFFRRIESLAGWPAGATHGSYQPRLQGCLRQHSATPPGFAVLSLGVYLQVRRSWRTQVLGQVQMFAGAGQRLYLVVKKGGARTLADLRGKRLVSNHLAETRFLNRVLFGGKLDVRKHFTLRQVYRTTKGMRDVARGRADATIINDDELRTLHHRSWGRKLQIMHRSPPLPGAPLVAFRGVARPADIQRVRKVIAHLCRGPAGKKLCQSSGILSMRPATQATFAAMIRRYGR